ncbi:MAG TPA: hypothetical protein VNB64_05080 [Solirubrobacteraceae bacterium]|nr:hypothetical protein [Solirubrobacteraceae bacterium]
MSLRPPLALAGAALALVLVPAPAGAFQIGMQDDGAFVSESRETRVRALERAQAVGVTYIRITMVWEGFRNHGWRPYDAAIQDARDHGMDVQLTVTGNPLFTMGGEGFLGYRWPNAGRYASWLGAVARHFKGRVAFYSIWNEPNLSEYLSPQHVGRRAVGHEIYARLVKAGYLAVKRADPRAKVLLGEAAPSGHPVRFLERAARSVPGGLRADGWAHHPYQFVRVAPGRPQSRYSGGISNVGAMQSALRRLARERVLRTRTGDPVPIYFTEFGYPRPGAYYGMFSEAVRASYTVAAFRLAKRAGVKAMVWYQLYTVRGRTRPRLWDTGLIAPDGTESLTYRRLRSARRSLVGF